jgi:FkbM family methyltransferase
LARAGIERSMSFTPNAPPQRPAPSAIAVNWYRIKRTVLQPYIRYKRYRERHQTGFIKFALERHYYSPSFYRFIGAYIMDPDILRNAPIHEGGIVVDAGGHDGEWSERLHGKYRPRILLFEPDPASLARSEERFADNPDVRCFGFGLADRDAELTLIQKGLGSTFHRGIGGTGSPMPARVRDVAAVLDELGLERIDLMKVNIEGGEFDLLDRLIEVGRLPGIGCLLIQFHEWIDGAHGRRRRIRKALRRTHSLEWDYPWVWEKWISRDTKP